MGHGAGNPAPIGLAAFALSITMLGALNAGLIEKQFKELLTMFGFWWAGLGQVAVGLLELILHGNTFGALVFCTYGCLWVSLSSVWFHTIQNEVNKFNAAHEHGAPFEAGYLGAHDYKTGEALMLFLFAFITLFFFVVSLRKNRALQVCLGILFWSLVFAGLGEFNEDCKKVGGWLAICTGASAFYILAAEILNDEWGKTILPGLAPMIAPKSADADGFRSVFCYDKSNNCVYLDITNRTFHSTDTVEKFGTYLAKEFGDLGQKVHVVVNYKGSHIAPQVETEYHAMVERLESEFYLTARRFPMTTFGGATDGSHDAGGESQQKVRKSVL